MRLVDYRYFFWNRKCKTYGLKNPLLEGQSLPAEALCQYIVYKHEAADTMQASLFVRLFVMIVLVFHNSWLSLHTSHSIYSIAFTTFFETWLETKGLEMTWTAETTIEANVELHVES